MNASFAQKHKLLGNSEEWKEVKRTNFNKQNLDYNDTFYLKSDSTGQVFLQKNHFLYKVVNAAKVDKKLIVNFGYGPNEWMVQKDNIVLADSLPKYYRYFQLQPKRLPAFDFNEKQKAIDGPDKEISKIDESKLIGNWFVYKRINTGNKELNRKEMVSSFKFEQNGDILGNARMVNGGAKTDCKIKMGKDGRLMLTNSEGQSSSLKVFKQTENEIIFEDEHGIKCFLKKD